MYRKPTHTDKYLDYNSHHPSQHKRSVVNTLLRKTEEIPSTNARRSRERTHVIKVLRDNNYPLRFIRSCKSYHSCLRRDSNIPTTLPAPAHLQRQHLLFFRMLKAFLREFREYYATMMLKWVSNLAMFCARVSRDQRTNLLLCSAEVLFTRSAASCIIEIYYGQTDRALETRLKQHKRAVRVGDNNSKIAQHANQFVHNIDFDHATIVFGIRKVTTTRETNILLSRMSTKPSCKHARLLLVAFCWRSTRRTVNRYKAVIQLAYKNNR